MRCPYCGYGESKVTDSRNASDVNAIRRRRECLQCLNRFTTFETVDLMIQVKKRNGTYEEFQLDKLIRGLASACRHTRISHEHVQGLGSDIAHEIMEKKMKEVEATEIGEIVMQRLKKIDTVAYIRFACVYRRFKDVDELMNEIHTVADA